MAFQFTPLQIKNGVLAFGVYVTGTAIYNELFAICNNTHFLNPINIPKI